MKVEGGAAKAAVCAEAAPPKQESIAASGIHKMRMPLRGDGGSRINSEKETK